MKIRTNITRLKSLGITVEIQVVKQAIFRLIRLYHRLHHHLEFDKMQEGRIKLPSFFLYLSKIPLLRSLTYFFIIVVSISLYGCRSKSKKASSNYSYLQWGEYLLYYRKMDSAFLMFSQAANSTTDSIEKGKAYNYMGAMQHEVGDLYGAQESLTVLTRIDPVTVTMTPGELVAHTNAVVEGVAV